MEIVVLAIVFLVFLTISLIFLLTVKQDKKILLPGQDVLTGLNMRCENSKCDDGLTCVDYENFSICKKNLGESCVSLHDCVLSSKKCSGICYETLYGGLNQEGPCNQGLELQDGICKYKTGEPCKVTLDCSYGHCDVTCQEPLEDGAVCEANVDCRSKNCDYLFFCQPIGTFSGREGAACDIRNNDCRSGMVCHTEDEEFFGVCSIVQDTWPSDQPCGVGSACIEPTLCLNGICKFPSDMSCLNSGKCIESYSCVNGSCIPGDGDPKLNGEKWSIVEWVRSGEGRIGRWEHIKDIPFFSTMSLKSGSMGLEGILYSEGSIKSVDSLEEINLNWVVPSDWNGVSPQQLLLGCKFVQTNSGLKIFYAYSILKSGNRFIYFYLGTYEEDYNVLIPSFNAENLNPPSIVLTSFDFDAREIDRIVYIAEADLKIGVVGDTSLPFSAQVHGSPTGITSALFYNILPTTTEQIVKIEGEVMTFGSQTVNVGENISSFAVSKREMNDVGDLEVLLVSGTSPLFFSNGVSFELPATVHQESYFSFEELENPRSIPRIFMMTMT